MSGKTDIHRKQKVMKTIIMTGMFMTFVEMAKKVPRNNTLVI